MKWDKIHGKYFSQCLEHNKCSKYIIAMIIQVFWGSPDFKYFVPFSDYVFPFEIPKCDHCAFLFCFLRRLCFFRHQNIKLPPLPTLDWKPSILVRDILLRPKADLCPWRIGRRGWGEVGEEAWSWTQKYLVNKVFSFPQKYTQWVDKLEVRDEESFHQVCP